MRRAALKMHLRYGDSRVAVVVSVAPLVVAAYSDEFDGVVLLQFPPELAQRFKLKVGSPLLTINTYDAEGELRPDIARASAELRTMHRNFYPVIADFVSDDADRISARKREITTDEWNRAYQFGRLAMKRPTALFRDGVRGLDHATGDDPDAPLPAWVQRLNERVAADDAQRAADAEARAAMPLNWQGAVPGVIGALAFGFFAYWGGFHAPDPAKEGGSLRLLLLLIQWIRGWGGTAGVLAIFGGLALLCLVAAWAVLTNRITDDD